MRPQAAPTPRAEASWQARRYLQASIVGTLANFFSRFAFAPFVGFGASLILANYVGMAVVFLLSYRRAFGMEKATGGMVLRFVTVAHVGLVVVWAAALLALYAARLAGKTFFPLPRNAIWRWLACRWRWLRGCPPLWRGPVMRWASSWASSSIF